MRLGPTNSWDRWSNGGFGIELTPGDHTVTISCTEADCGFINLDSVVLGTFDTSSVQLASAAFAAMGASHIEIGQGGEMLVGPYFPDSGKQMDNALTAWVQTYYDVITGYENLLYGPTLRDANGVVAVPGYNVSVNGEAGTIWATDTRNDGMTTIHLINLLDNDDQWRNSATPPRTLKDVRVRYHLSGQEVPTEVTIASPDRDGGRSTTLDVTSGQDTQGTYIDFTVPELETWDFVYFGQSTQGSGNVVTRAGTCLDVSGGSSAPGTPVQVWDCADVPAQSWTYDGSALTALGSCLTLADDSGADGTGVRIEDCQGLATQTWVRTTRSQFYNPASGKCLDSVGGATASGTPVHLWTCHSGASQRWTTPR